MRQKILILFVLVFAKSFSQGSGFLKAGDPAPSFIVNMDGNSIKSYVMPYMKRILLVHFWGSDVITSRIYGQRLNNLAKRYESVVYKNAEGFEIVAVAVQTNKAAWKEAIKSDSLSEFTHGIALRGYDEEICKKFGVVSLPTDILIDEAGLIIAIDPKITTIEDILDDRKNFQPIKKDITGTLAQSSNASEVLKFGKLYLFNNYGDSIAKTVTSSTGKFTFSDIKLNQDFILKVDNKTDIITSDPVALYTPGGELLLNGITREGGFTFHIPARLSYKLIESELQMSEGKHINIMKNIEFASDGAALTSRDEKELNPLLSLLQKNNQAKLEFTTNTDSKIDDDAAMALTVKQAATITHFFTKRGIDKTRLNGLPKGSDQPRVICDYTHACTEDEHKENRRVEFFIHKN